jgi:quercetin dioxygenase-like cupin family protein
MTFHTPADHVETLWVAGDRLRVLGHLPGSDAHLIEVEVPPGSGTPPHIHASPELFWVIDGTLTVRTFGAARPEVALAGPGSSVRIDSHVPHNYSNDGPTAARMAVLVDGAMLAFFRDLGRFAPPAPGEAPDVAAIGAAMQRHGIALAA